MIYVPQQEWGKNMFEQKNNNLLIYCIIKHISDAVQFNYVILKIYFNYLELIVNSCVTQPRVRLNYSN